MKKGINAWSFPSDMEINERIRLAKQAGFEGIELVLSEKGPLSLESSADEIAGYKDTAKEEGIEISGLATGLFWLYSLTSNRQDIREKAKNIVKKQLDTAAILGTDVILVVPGAVGVDFRPDEVVPDARNDGYFVGHEVVEYDIAYERSLEAIKDLAAYAQEKKIIIGIENVWNKFLLSPLEMRNFIDEIGSDYVGVYFDVGNVLITGYPQQWIRILGSRIKRIHFKDYRRQSGGLAGFVDLLSGEVDFIKVMDNLESIGYDSFLNAEMTPVYKNYPEQILYNTSKSMDKILKRL